MRKSVDYLDAAKVALGGISDYKLAQVLSVKQQTISCLRQGKSTIGERTALRLAPIIGVPAELIVADAHVERERDPEIRALWQSISDIFSAPFKRLPAFPNACFS